MTISLHIPKAVNAEYGYITGAEVCILYDDANLQDERPDLPLVRMPTLPKIAEKEISSPCRPRRVTDSLLTPDM